MKSRILLLSVVLFAATMFRPSQAKADIIGDLLNGLCGGSSTPNQGTNLPINGNAIYLAIAGLAIGIITVRKAKKEQVGVRG